MRELREKTKALIAAKEREDKIANLLQQVIETPPDSHEMLRDIYAELTDLVPNNKAYAEKHGDHDLQARKVKERELLRILKNVPATQFQRNRDLYSELRNLFPENSRYIARYEHYAKKIKQRELHIPGQADH